MKTSPSPLLPVLRSRTQAGVLATLFLGADEGLSLAELSRATGFASPTIHHEVERLEEAGIVTSTRMGNARIVKANKSLPYHNELKSLLTKTYGPVAILTRVLSDIDGIESAFVFGSWARRYHGEPGEFPHDIDLLIVGKADPDSIYKACREAEQALHVDVNPIILTSEEWTSRSGGFRQAIRRGPLVELMGSQAEASQS